MEYTDRIDVAEIIDAMNGFKKLKKALGKDNYMYRIIMDALNEKMNSDIESCFEDEYETEMMYAEAIVQKIETGSYIDLDEMRKYIKHKKWQDIITSYANKHGIQQENVVANIDDIYISTPKIGFSSAFFNIFDCKMMRNVTFFEINYFLCFFIGSYVLLYSRNKNNL